MRHAIRCAACLGIAVACERLLEIPHGAWIPMTAAIVLRPDFGGTLRFGLLRVAGTFGGLLLTTLVVHLVLDSVVQSLRSYEHPSELQSLMRISYPFFCLQKKKNG